MEQRDNSKISTVKLAKATKERIDKLRVYKRETYDEILQNMLAILNICKVNPEAARRRLLGIDRKKRKETRGSASVISSRPSSPQQHPQQGKALR